MLGAGRGRGPQRNSFKKDYPPSQNGVAKKRSDYIEILHTETLIKEVCLEGTQLYWFRILPNCLFYHDDLPM
jgi:hypothetical protein